MAYYVRMTDKFMSGWGEAQGKSNVVVVECPTIEQAEQIERAAKRRSEMRRVEICLSKPKNRPNVLYSWKHYDQLGGPWKE
jgi:hypothetical protein